MSSTRRFSGEDSPTRTLLLDSAEKLMMEEGYNAVTSRQLATRAGLKHQIVYYYFRTMDDLFLAVHERMAKWFTARVDEALTLENPLRALWELSGHRQSAALQTEFMALANHRKAIRAALADQMDSFRETAVKALARYFEERGIDGRISPLAVAVLTASINRHMVMEESLGVSRGHDQARALVEQMLDQLDAGSSAPELPANAGAPVQKEDASWRH